MSVTIDEVSDLIQANNIQLMASFKELLTDTAGQIKCVNETSTAQQMKEIKKLKFQEPHRFKRKANKNQYKFNLKRKVRNCLWNGKNKFFLLTSLNTVGVRSKNTNNTI